MYKSNFVYKYYSVLQILNFVSFYLKIVLHYYKNTSKLQKVTVIYISIT